MLKAAGSFVRYVRKATAVLARAGILITFPCMKKDAKRRLHIQRQGFPCIENGILDISGIVRLIAQAVRVAFAVRTYVFHIFTEYNMSEKNVQGSIYGSSSDEQNILCCFLRGFLFPLIVTISVSD